MYNLGEKTEIYKNNASNTHTHTNTNLQAMVKTRKEKFRDPYNITNGEGNGNPLQYSCLENPMGEAW